MLSIAESYSDEYSRPAGGYEPPRDYFEADAHSTNGVYVPRLFLAGDHRLVRARAVAVVGSRAASMEGCAFAAEVACGLVKAGFAVMSGLALGIDTAAHRAAIAAGGRTIAVIGTPLERAYPQENARLQRDIYEEHLLVSPFAAGTRTHRGHFPTRNRVMARLAVATVVAEADENSGTVHQVRESLACGKPVFVSRAAAQDCSWLRSIPSHDRLRILDRPSDVADVIAGRCP
jgi:DNA processing protein